MLERHNQTSADGLTGDLYRRSIEEAKDYAIFMTDAGGRVHSWNPGAERILGYGEAEILARNASLLHPRGPRKR
jgi:PAS domain S-box-containing protein